MIVGNSNSTGISDSAQQNNEFNIQIAEDPSCSDHWNSHKKARSRDQTSEAASWPQPQPVPPKHRSELLLLRHRVSEGQILSRAWPCGERRSSVRHVHALEELDRQTQVKTPGAQRPVSASVGVRNSALDVTRPHQRRQILIADRRSAVVPVTRAELNEVPQAAA